MGCHNDDILRVVCLEYVRMPIRMKTDEPVRSFCFLYDTYRIPVPFWQLAIPSKPIPLLILINQLCPKSDLPLLAVVVLRFSWVILSIFERSLVFRFCFSVFCPAHLLEDHPKIGDWDLRKPCYHSGGKSISVEESLQKKATTQLGELTAFSHQMLLFDSQIAEKALCVPNKQNHSRQFELSSKNFQFDWWYNQSQENLPRFFSTLVCLIQCECFYVYMSIIIA